MYFMIFYEIALFEIKTTPLNVSTQPESHKSHQSITLQVYVNIYNI